MVRGSGRCGGTTRRRERNSPERRYAGARPIRRRRPRAGRARRPDGWRPRARFHTVGLPRTRDPAGHADDPRIRRRRVLPALDPHRRPAVLPALRAMARARAGTGAAPASAARGQPHTDVLRCSRAPVPPVGLRSRGHPGAGLTGTAERHLAVTTAFAEAGLVAGSEGAPAAAIRALPADAERGLRRAGMPNERQECEDPIREDLR